MTDKQIIIDENKINPNDWLEPYKPIPACEIKDCNHLVYAGNDVYGCRIAEDGLVCDDFNNDDECCMYRQLEYYKEALKAKEQECERLKEHFEIAKEASNCNLKALGEMTEWADKLDEENDQLKAENEELKKRQENVANMFDKTCRCKYLNEENAHCSFYNKECIAINQCLYRNQQTLTEIKEIIEQGVKIHDDIIVSKQILQKISEVEE